MARHNSQELRTRPIRGEQRHVIARTLQSQLPRQKYLQDLLTLENDVYESENRDEAPSSPSILKNLSWEHRKKTESRFK